MNKLPVRLALSALFLAVSVVAHGQGASPKSSIAGTVASIDDRSVPDCDRHHHK